MIQHDLALPQKLRNWRLSGEEGPFMLVWSCRELVYASIADPINLAQVVLYTTYECHLSLWLYPITQEN